MISNTYAFNNASSDLLTNQPGYTRAAFDLGSGTFKLSVAEVRGQVIQKVKFSKMIKVGLGADLAESQNVAFSEKIQILAVDALQELIWNARENGAVQFAGIATEAFRRAANGSELLCKLQKQTGVTIRLISQEEEGVLAFDTFLNVFPDVSVEKCIALDVGSSSCQLTKKNDHSYQVMHTSLGITGALKIFSEEIKKMPYKRGTLFTQITMEEIEALIDIILATFFINFDKNAQFSHESAEILYLDDWVDEIEQRTGLRDRVSRTQIWDALLKTMDSANAKPNSEEQFYLIAYALLFAIMSKLEIETLRIKYHVTGNTLGMITAKHFWPSYTKQG